MNTFHKQIIGDNQIDERLDANFSKIALSLPNVLDLDTDKPGVLVDGNLFVPIDSGYINLVGQASQGTLVIENIITPRNTVNPCLRITKKSLGTSYQFQNSGNLLNRQWGPILIVDNVDFVKYEYFANAEKWQATDYISYDL